MPYVKKTLKQMAQDAYVRAMNESLFVEQMDEIFYLVYNLDHKTLYKVWLDGDHIAGCECPHHFYRGVLCKHMVAVSNETGIEVM